MLDRIATSRFLARSYGGYTAAQSAAVREELTRIRGRKRIRILDPMGGQAVALCAFAAEGHDVHVADINPAVLCLASLRDPRLVRDGERLSGAFARLVSQLPPVPLPPEAPEFSPDWLSQRTLAQLVSVGRSLRIHGRKTIQGASPSCIQELPALSRFGLGISILAARALAIYRDSDNAAWLKRGGLARERPVPEILRDAITLWLSWSAAHRAATVPATGSLSVYWLDIANGSASVLPSADVIVTSPPYANRLDYTSLWGPEIAVFSAVTGVDLRWLKNSQIGSTVVSGLSLPQAATRILPRTMASALGRIAAADHHKASKSYYFPYFLNYAISLRRALLASASRLRANGRLLVFIRDTSRKGTLIRLGEFSETVLRRSAGLAIVNRSRHHVRSHIGLRRGADHGTRGLTQTEWWLTFGRGRR